MSSKVVHLNKLAPVELKIKKYLNSLNRKELGITGTVRTTGDKIPQILSNVFESFIKDIAVNFIYHQGRKSMSNFEFEDKDNFIFHVNVVTHCMDLRMSMPNLTSVDRLTDLYEDDNNYFIILLIDYYKSRKTDFISSVKFMPIEFISLDSIGFGALGAGQIQIKKVSQIVIEPQNRREWMIGFYDKLSAFYALLNRKTAARLNNTIKLRYEWGKRSDNWR